MTKQKQLWPEGHQCFVSHNLAFNGKFLYFQLEKLSSMDGSFEEIYILHVAKECPEKQLSFPLEAQAWHHLSIQYDCHILWASACLRATNLCWSGKPPVHFWRPLVLRNWGKAEVRTACNNKTMLLSQGKKIPLFCRPIIWEDENSLLLSYFETSLEKALEGNKVALAEKCKRCLLPCFSWDLHKVLAISNRSHCLQESRAKIQGCSSCETWDWLTRSSSQIFG